LRSTRCCSVSLLVYLVATLLVGQPADAADSLAARLERVMSRPEFRHGIFGVSIVSLDSGKVVYEKNADLFFVPGSTTKLVTVASALLLLHPEYRYHTRVYRTGAIGTDGALAGDLVLVVGGDPNLSGRIRPDDTLAFENEDHSYGGADSRGIGDPLAVIRELAQQVASHGIRRVTGRVIVDASLFPEGERELGTGVVLSAAVVNDNVIDVLVTPGEKEGDPVRLEISPATAYVRLVNQATTGKTGSPNSLDFSKDESAADGSHTVTLTGKLPLDAGKVMDSYPVAQPHRFAEVVFAEALQERGIVASAGLPEEGRDLKALAIHYEPGHLVAEHISPPLSAEAKVILKVSQNLHASMLPYVLGALVSSAHDPAAGFPKMREALTREGLDVDGAMQGDGAGGRARFTPRFITTFLARMAKEPFFPAYLEALPILGRDGTLAKIQTESPAAGHVHAKTGTYGEADLLNGGLILSGKGLAGYVTTADGRHLAFALYVNNVKLGADPDAAQKVAGQALGEMAAAAYDAPR
jgi:PBP4 family serine-type D-alanyl-D-alanine carboxypeptidase